MDFQQMQDRALQIRHHSVEADERSGKTAWTREQIMEGLVGDVGDLMKLVQAKAGVRHIEDVDQKMAHEVADCLWALLVLAHEYGIDMERSFQQTMDELEARCLKIGQK